MSDDNERSRDMNDKAKQFWLITVAQDDCRGFMTIPIRKHPADYMAENPSDSLIFAIPISRSQFLAAKRAYENE